MARYRKDFPFPSSPDALLNAIGQYLSMEGYELTQYEQETVFKKGYGIMTGPTYIKVSYQPNYITVEAWMKYALLPGVYVGEIGLTGFVGAAVKGPLKRRIAQIESMIVQAAGNGSYAAPQPFGAQAPNPSAAAATAAQPSAAGQAGFVPPVQGLPTPASSTEAETQVLMDSVCPACGATVAAGSAYCTNCGQKLNPVPPAQPYVPAQQPNFAQTPPYAPAQQPGFAQAQPFAPPFTPPQPPAGQFISKRDYRMQYVPRFAKEVRNVAILCYVCAGLNAVISLFFNPIGLIDSLILLGLTLGMHLGKSKACAIAVLVLACIEMLVGIILFQSPTGFLWLIAGIWAVVIFNKADKQYKAYMLSAAQYSAGAPYDQNRQF